VISHLRIHNANALSSIYTVGFPAMTAWLGGVHALQRRLQAVDSLQQVTLPRMAVSCHNCNVQLYRGKHDYVNSVIGTSNPLGKDGKRPAFIESPRCHLDVSLLLEVTSVNSDNQDTFLTAVASTFERMKVAGGDILSRCMVYKEKQPRPRDKTMLKLFYINDFAEDDVLKHQHSIMHMLMPGFVVVGRSKLLQSLPGDDMLDKLLYSQSVTYESVKDKQGKVTDWQNHKNYPEGWLVPLAVGFRDLSGAVHVEHQRDNSCEHHFVEPIVTLGEFKMPTRMPSLESMMWSYQIDVAHGLYLCVNDYESYLDDRF
jgi:CRISPR-associated protein Csy2